MVRETPPATRASWSGRELLAAFASAAAWLSANAAVVNALNVFPVPDGDTGTNMSLTLEAALAEASARPSDHAGEVAGAIAHGALMGARGNSGVILSQVLRGMARALAETPELSARDLAGALREAATTAYRGVIKPVEGTMLTVIRETAAAAEVAVPDVESVPDLLAPVVVAAHESVARTPSLLPVLQQAGVVDAGGQGLAVIFEGWLRYAEGRADEPMPRPVAAAVGGAEPAFSAEFLDAHSESRYGY